MSIQKIKELSSDLKSGKLTHVLAGSPQAGSLGIGKKVKELLDLIEAYKEPDPKIDAPPKPKVRRTRATTKKDITTE